MLSIGLGKLKLFWLEYFASGVWPAVSSIGRSTHQANRLSRNWSIPRKILSETGATLSIAVTQGINRIHLGGADGRKQTENDSDKDRNEKCYRDRLQNDARS